MSDNKNKKNKKNNSKKVNYTSSIIAGLVGGAFFAVPYAALSWPFLPALAVGAVAFGAAELLFYKKDKPSLEETNKPLYETLMDARVTNEKIADIIPKIEDEELVKNVKEITVTVDKIISTIEKKPDKAKRMDNFFNYYLPVTYNILKKYDEIENQRLSSKEGKDFMDNAKNMISKINDAFKNQLSNLYQSEMIDTDAEMKVFDSMLKADGYDPSSDLKVK